MRSGKHSNFHSKALMFHEIIVENSEHASNRIICDGGKNVDEKFISNTLFRETYARNKKSRIF